MPSALSRRDVLARTAAAAAAAVALTKAVQAQPRAAEPFGYCLNTGTLRAFNLPIDQEIGLAAEAGYQAIEPWLDNLRRYQGAGKSLDDLRKLLADKGLVVPSAIGFANWLSDDETARQKGLDQARSDMELVKAIGGKALAAPPSGATNKPIDVHVAAERYAALLRVGAEVGIVPELEIWGFSQAIATLSEAVAVAMATGHAEACVLPDVFHLYKGGTDFNSLRLCGPHTFRAMHMNDFPADPPRERSNDGNRRMPGDGVAPWPTIFGHLRDIGWHGYLSLELFPPKGADERPKSRIETGLAKMKAVVAKGLA